MMNDELWMSFVGSEVQRFRVQRLKTHVIIEMAIPEF
jgi:hypothetical protein